jgi:hypothetical protein
LTDLTVNLGLLLGIRSNHGEGANALAVQAHVLPAFSQACEANQCGSHLGERLREDNGQALLDKVTGRKRVPVNIARSETLVAARTDSE